VRPRFFWVLGFRPFFLLAGAVAVLAMGAWILALRGIRTGAGPAWHGHEMIFGYGGAVMAGFILTAARNWTGRPTAQGFNLLLLVALWLAARIGAAVDPLAGAIVGGVFFLALAGFIARPIFGARSRRNYGFPFILVGFATLDLLYGLLPSARVAILRAGVHLLIVLVAVMGGRIVPLFTRSGAPGSIIRPRDRRDDWALTALIVFAIVGSGTPVPGSLAGAVAAIGAGLNLWRMRGWGLPQAWRRPLLLVLHLGYGFIPLGLGLAAAADFGAPLSFTVPLHALAVGGFGLLSLGMMARVTRGHTGRPLIADPTTSLAFALLLAAALVRVFGPLAFPAAGLTTLTLAAALWIAAFGLFLAVYTHALATPRLDNRPG